MSQNKELSTWSQGFSTIYPEMETWPSYAEDFLAQGGSLGGQPWGSEGNLCVNLNADSIPCIWANDLAPLSLHLKNKMILVTAL